MENLSNSNNKSCNRKWKFSKFAPILAGALFLMNPSWSNAQNISNHTRAKAEVSTSTILDRLNQKIWISLPADYNEKVLDFVLNDTIMRTRSATDYTEEFIINEMQKDRWINKQDQLLFIWSKIYGWISQKKLYNRLDDENENRSAEYKKSLKQVASCYEEYKKWFKTYMETKSAEYDKQSAEARQQSADYDRRIAEARQQSAEAIKTIMQQDSIRLKKSMIEFYEIYIRSPSTVKKEDIDFAKESTKTIIGDCKKYWINYRAILLKEVWWDAKKVDEILKFYGVE